MKRLFLLALGLLLLPDPVSAQSQRELVEIRRGQPIQIRPDRAYLLLRIGRPEGVAPVEPIFMRVPTPEEMAAYDIARREAFVRAEPELVRRRQQQLRRNAEVAATGRGRPDPVDPVPSLETFRFDYDGVGNLNKIDAGRALVPGRPEATYLIEAVPGDYVLYGLMFGGWTPQVHTCLCLGTVGFSAPAGVVTDLGTYLGDRVDRLSAIPELRAESGFGPSVNGFIFLFGAAMRPPSPEMSRPGLPDGATVRPVVYRAIGKFVEARSLAINRLAPIPGVLAYDGARVIDVRSGRQAPDMIGR